VRLKRANLSFENTYFMLGAVGNKPTFDGVKSLLDYKSTHEGEYCLIVAGYGTEAFKEYDSESIKVLGSIDSQKLNELMDSSKALLINQPQTTGFLTKIVEFNLSGIPMFILSGYLQGRHLEEYGIHCLKAEEVGKLNPVFPKKFFNKPKNNDLLSL